MTLLPVERFLFPRLDVSSYCNDGTYSRRIQTLVREGVGGFICFDGTLRDCAEAIEDLRRFSGHPLLFAADCEYGTAMRFSDGTEFPAMMGLAESGSPGLVRRVAAAIGREMAATGLDWNLGPVLDINTNRANPIINVRSFGEEAEVVAAFGNAYIRGTREVGILSCGKHLPGHGDTSVDSHIGLPIHDRSADQIDDTELVPFRSGVTAGVDSLMTAHLLVPSLGAETVPVSLSREAVTRLRRMLAFDGVLVTDALDMGALDGIDELPLVKAFNAGNDILEIPGNPEAGVKELREGVKSGKIDVVELEASSKRLSELYRRKRIGRASTRMVLETIQVENRKLAQEAARRSIRLRGDPIPSPSMTGDWLIVSGPMDEDVGSRLHSLLRGKVPGLTNWPADRPCLRKGVEGRAPVLLLAYSPRGGAGVIGLGRDEIQTAISSPPEEAWVVTLGNPYLPDGVRFRGSVDLFSSGDNALKICAELLAGRFSV